VKSGAIINGREILDMSDPNWISAANLHHSESVLSKIRTDSGVEASSRSSHFCRTLKQTVKTLPNATANDIWLGAVCDAATCPQCSPTASHRLTATLVGPRALMFTAGELGDHILADFDLQDILTVVPELRNRPLRPQWLSVAIGRLLVRLQVGTGLTNSAPKYTVILSGTYRFGSAGL
jgi:hypothetical protein